MTRGPSQHGQEALWTVANHLTGNTYEGRFLHFGAIGRSTWSGPKWFYSLKLLLPP